MLSRRSFIQTAAISVSLPAQTGWCAGLEHVPADSCRIITTGLCSDTRAFRRAMHCEDVRFDNDQGASLEGVMHLLSGQRLRYLAGLTRDSDYLLITQLALENGFLPVFKGEHQYAGPQLIHRLRTNRASLEQLARALPAAGRDWAGVLARRLPGIAPGSGVQRPATVTMPGGRPADGPGYLVSWAFARSGT